jgi:transcription factor MYC2
MFIFGGLRGCHGGRILGWGDGYYKGPKENEINEMKNVDQGVREEDQQLRKKVLRELQALVSCSEDEGSDYVTDTEWFYLVSMSHSFPQGVG